MMKNWITSLFCLLIFGSTFGQHAGPYIVKGIVYDESKEVLIGASVLEKGTTNGTFTDIDGSFVLGLKDSLSILIISYLGYESEEIKVSSNGKEVEAILSPGMVLEEVTVNGYHGPKERKVKRNRNKNRNAVAYEVAPSTPAMIQGRSSGMVMQPHSYIQQDLAIQHNTEEYNLIQENKFLAVENEPLSTFSIDVDAASYSNMRRFIQNGGLPPRDAVRIEEMVNYFDYEYPQPKEVHPFAVVTELSESPWNQEHQLLHIGLQGKHIPTENLPASNLVFLIDVSGSMNSSNKLPLLKSSFKLLTAQLRAKDKVSMVVYAGSSGVVLKPTSGDRKHTIREALDKLQAGGSTAGGAGIQLAYKLARENFVEGGNNRVILATDGDFNVGQTSEGELVQMIEKERESGVFLTVMGFGTGNYKDSKMQQLANKGNGNHAYIDNIEEARKVLVNEFGGSMFTIAKDVKLQLEFNPAYVAGYRLIGYENRMLANEDFNDDQKDAGELGAGHTVTAIYEIIPADVESDFLKGVDKLKYQSNKTAKGAKNGELMTVKLRYKKPDGDKSILLSHVQSNKSSKLQESSDNFRWSAAVAEFGMLLRDSEFKQASSYEQIIDLAKTAKGADEEGYRMEFIRMVRSVRDLSETTTVGK